MTKTKKRLKKNVKTTILILIIIVCLINLSISIDKIIKWKLDNIATDNQVNDIKNIIKIEEVEDNENVEIIEQETEVIKSNPYWDYINMNLINVDFSELKSINNSVKGWIQVNGTNINYPFVQASDNKYYLTHSFDKTYNSAGWVFLDYRNNIQSINKNTIIYAHGRMDTTMFGSLKKILSSGWLNNSNNYVIKLSTEKENTLWQVFSIYHIPTTSDYLKVDFEDDEDFLEFSNMLLNRSTYNFNTSLNENDNILTLSTCYNKTDKMVLHAKLIKRELKELS